MGILSCIKDVPICMARQNADDELHSKDTLKAARYAEALSKFIRHADTPVTIGIQGGWGSGKTSLFSIIQTDLESHRDDAPLCITVNAWEHSLFQENQGRSAIVLSILTSIIEMLQEAVNEGKDIDQAGKSFINQKIAPAIKKTFSTLARYMPSLIGAALSAATGMSATVRRETDSSEDQIPRLADQIRTLHDNLADLVSNICRNGKPIKTVIFIDDLDRVQPVVAVEILDVIKNIFDIENCIFILAIDYEVVVKGLESKFGERKDENEREFRQYFDKIIQVPFSMPIGSYSREMGRMLVEAFKFLEIYEGYDLEKEVMDKLASIAKLATGGNPRSIKRLLNTLSLLQYIPIEDEENLDAEQKLVYLQIRFIIVALHLNYPEITRYIMESNKYTDWSLTDLEGPWELNLARNRQDLEALDKNGDLSVYFDEDWEKVVFCLCAKSKWLKRKAPNVSRMLNMLRATLNQLGSVKYENDLEAVPICDEGMEALSRILDAIAVVSIDSGQDNKKEKLKYDHISRSMKRIHANLAEGAHNKYIAPYSGSSYASQDENNDEKRIYQLGSGEKPIENISLEFRDDGSSQMGLIITLSYSGAESREARQILKEYVNKLAQGFKLGYFFSNSSNPPFVRLMFFWNGDIDNIDRNTKIIESLCKYSLAIHSALSR